LPDSILLKSSTSFTIESKLPAENLEVLRFSAGNLLSIVNDVLDFNKIESGKLVFENTKFNLVELMHSISGGQMISAQEKGLLFDLFVDPAFNKKTLSNKYKASATIFLLDILKD